ncbi:retrotransposable element Tf2, partial [Tanacetum coccineum]
ITTPAQMKWLPKLMRYDYEGKYKKGVNNAAADALSRVQNEGKLMASMSLQDGNMAKKHYTWNNGQLPRKKKLVSGKDEELRKELMAHFHGSSVGGHSGVKVTTYRMSFMLYWKGMRKYIKKFIHECIHCQRNNPDLAAYPRLLQPLPIPNNTWESISIDFIEALPRSQGYTVIFMVVDRLTKYAHFMPLYHPFTAAQVAQEFLDIEGLLEPEPIALLDRKMVKKHNAVVVYGLVHWSGGTKEDST